MINRRQFIKLTAGGAVGLYLTSKFGSPQLLAQIPGGTLMPGDVPKYLLPLVKPPAMPLSKGSNKTRTNITSPCDSSGSGFYHQLTIFQQPPFGVMVLSIIPAPRWTQTHWISSAALSTIPPSPSRPRGIR